MRFAVDPWDPTYGTSLDADLGASSAEVDAGVEVEPPQWGPVDPERAVAAAEAVLFVDGVRRVDAQVWIDEDGRSMPALCASYAAGVVCCCRGGGAHLLSAHLRRGLFTTAAQPADIVTGAGTYRAAPPVADRADAPPMQLLSQALQAGLAEVELVAAAAACAGRPGEADLLVVDGPLRGRAHLPRAIGFVKSHRSDYLPATLGAVVAELAPGQRTPVFRVGTSWGRHTWYLRLPCAPGAPWAGIVRVECGDELTADAAVALAALSQATLVRFASTEYKDSRAPQNLYPIAGLERALRRRLGDAALLYRALRRAATRPVHDVRSA